MKRSVKAALLSASVIGLLLGLRLFHLGPFGIRAGDDVVLARHKTADGVRFCIIAHRTENIGEPYSVTLYRTEPSGAVFSYWMGYEDSFWWGCSIRATDNPRVLQVLVYGSVNAVYNLEAGTLRFLDDYYNYGTQTGRVAVARAVPLAVTQN
jgi:hypothetical protein